MASTARTGRDFEHRARAVLSGNGYWTMRAAASKGPVDLIAMKPGQTVFVQCKRDGSLPPAEWNALYDLAMSLGAIPVMASLRPRRGVEWHQLGARKDGTRRAQPMTPFIIDQIEASL